MPRLKKLWKCGGQSDKVSFFILIFLFAINFVFRIEQEKKLFFCVKMWLKIDQLKFEILWCPNILKSDSSYDENADLINLASK